MLGMGKCAACDAKDAIIADLREQVREAIKTSLAVIDAKAYALRFPADRPARPENPLTEAAVMTSPAEFRRRRVDFGLSQEEIEASFAVEAETAQAQASATFATPFTTRRDEGA